MRRQHLLVALCRELSLTMSGPIRPAVTDAAVLAKAALARGDLIAAYDVTTAAIAEGDPGGTIRHQQVLALARMGDTERAMGLFAAYGLDRSTNAHERAIGARLLKDRAL